MIDLLLKNTDIIISMMISKYGFESEDDLNRSIMQKVDINIYDELCRNRSILRSLIWK